MNVNSDYQQHVEISKQLKMSESFHEARADSKESFEKIYNKAKEENINLTNAKDFLNSLSKDELSALQNHSLLVSEINVNSLNNEGAYNLLLHHYEKYDFDNDGLVSNGISKGSTFLPTNMPNKEKEVLVQTLNEMDEKDRFVSLLMLNPPKLVNIDGVISAQNNDKYMDYEAIMERIDQILNPPPLAYTSNELKTTFNIFKELFEKNFDKSIEQDEQNKSIRNRENQLSKAKLLA
jgi:hypothetical protein